MCSPNCFTSPSWFFFSNPPLHKNQHQLVDVDKNLKTASSFQKLSKLSWNTSLSVYLVQSFCISSIQSCAIPWHLIYVGSWACGAVKSCPATLGKRRHGTPRTESMQGPATIESTDRPNDVMPVERMHWKTHWICYTKHQEQRQQQKQ